MNVYMHKIFSCFELQNKYPYVAFAAVTNSLNYSCNKQSELLRCILYFIDSTFYGYVI